MIEKGKLVELEEKLGIKNEPMFSIEERLIRVCYAQQELIDKLMVHHPKLNS